MVSFSAIVTERFIRKILNRRLPDLRIDSASIAAILRDLESSTFESNVRRLALTGGALVASIIKIDTLAQLALIGPLFSVLERKVITLFILGSNYLDVKDPKSELITYKPTSEICSNRFAQFDS